MAKKEMEHAEYLTENKDGIVVETLGLWTCAYKLIFLLLNKKTYTPLVRWDVTFNG